MSTNDCCIVITRERDEGTLKKQDYVYIICQDWHARVRRVNQPPWKQGAGICHVLKSAYILVQHWLAGTACLLLRGKVTHIHAEAAIGSQPVWEVSEQLVQGCLLGSFTLLMGPNYAVYLCLHAPFSCEQTSGSLVR